MNDNKKYYWLKLKEDFFDDKYIKALRKLPDGDALCIIYQKMQLKSLKTEGFIQYDKILPSAEEELALVLDEDVNKVKLTLQALLNMGLVEQWENDTLYMVAMQNLIGSETAVAERVRKHREKQKMLQCNTDVTNSNTYIEIRDKRKEINLNIEKDNKRKKFVKPTIKEVKEYCIERNNNIDAENFIDYYDANGWKVGKNSMKDWKATIRTWERRNKEANNVSNKGCVKKSRDGSEFAEYD